MGDDEAGDVPGGGEPGAGLAGAAEVVGGAIVFAEEVEVAAVAALVAAACASVDVDAILEECELGGHGEFVGGEVAAAYGGE